MAASFPCSCSPSSIGSFHWKDDQVYGTFLISGWWFTYPSSKHFEEFQGQGFKDSKPSIFLCLVPSHSLYKISWGTTNQFLFNQLYTNRIATIRHTKAALSDGWQGARHILSPSYAATCWAVAASLRVPRVPPTPRPSSPGSAAPASAPLQTPGGRRPPRRGPPAKPLQDVKCGKNRQNTLKDQSYDSYD